MNRLLTGVHDRTAAARSTDARSIDVRSIEVAGRSVRRSVDVIGTRFGLLRGKSSTVGRGGVAGAASDTAT